MDKKPLNLRRKKLDSLLSEPISLRKLRSPPNGWIKEVREVLGMSAVALASRLGVIPQRISALEKGELEETVTLKKLREAAESLGCELVYSFVPKTSLEHFLQKQAEVASRRELASAHASMALEDQALNSKAREASIKELAEEMVRDLDRRIWRP